MSIVVKEHPKHKLRFPSFVCDYLLREDVPKPFDRLVKGFRCIAVVGGSGSGKTSLVLSLIQDRKVLKKLFNNVIAVIPETSRRSLKKDPFEDLHESKKYENLRDIDTIYEQLKYYSSENETSLLLIDDCQADLKDTSIANTLNKIISNRRHLKVSVIILLQVFNRLPLTSRKLINVLITFRPSRREWESISELLEYDDNTKSKIFRLCFPKEDTDAHRWVLIDVQHQKLWCGFSELLISEE